MSKKKQLKIVFFDKMAPDFIGKNKFFVFGNIFLSTKNFVSRPAIISKIFFVNYPLKFSFIPPFSIFFCSFGLWKKHKKTTIIKNNAHLAAENPLKSLKIVKNVFFFAKLRSSMLKKRVLFCVIAYFIAKKKKKNVTFFFFLSTDFFFFESIP